MAEIGSVDREARLCHDPRMDLEAARKTLSKRGAFSSKRPALKRLAFFVVAGVALVAGVLLRVGHSGQPDMERSAPILVPESPPSDATPAAETTDSVAKTPTPGQEPAAAENKQAEQTGAIQQAGPPSAAAEPELPGAGMILVSRKP